MSRPTNSDTLELRNDALSAGNIESLGVPVRGEESTGVIKEGESLVASVRNFGEDFEGVDIRDGLLASQRDRDAGGTEDCRGTSE